MTVPAPTLLPAFRSSGVTGRATWARVGGVEYLVPPSNPATPFLLRKRPWQPALSEAMLDAMRHGSGFLDVGAGFGYFAALIAKNLPRTPVYAVEDDPELLGFASANLVGFPNAQLLVGRVGTLAPEPDQVVTGSAWTTLLDLIEEYRSDVVRVNAGGSEVDVLASLDVGNLLQNDLTIFASVHSGSWQAGDRGVHAVVAEYEECGFEAFFVHENRTYAAYTDVRLERALRSVTSWHDRFDLLLARGRYLDAMRTG